MKKIFLEVDMCCWRIIRLVLWANMVTLCTSSNLKQIAHYQVFLSQTSDLTLCSMIADDQIYCVVKQKDTNRYWEVISEIQDSWRLHSIKMINAYAYGGGGGGGGGQAEWRLMGSDGTGVFGSYWIRTRGRIGLGWRASNWRMYRLVPPRSYPITITKNVQKCCFNNVCVTS